MVGLKLQHRCRSRPFMTRLQELARCSATRVYDRPRTAKRRDSRPRFSGVGRVGLSLLPAGHAGGRGFESRRPLQLKSQRVNEFRERRQPVGAELDFAYAARTSSWSRRQDDHDVSHRSVVGPTKSESVADRSAARNPGFDEVASRSNDRNCS